MGLVAVLVVVNIALMATIWVKKDAAVAPPQRGDAKEYLVKTLSLNKAQVEDFDSLRNEHFKKIAEYKQAMRFVKDRLFSLLNEKDTNRINTQITTYLKEKIGDIQANIDVETFQHFYRLRSLLNEQQKQKFDSTIQDVLRTLDPRAAGPDDLMPGGDRPGERMGPPPGGPGGMRPPPPGGEPPPH